jgi:hypothetical protein
MKKICTLLINLFFVGVIFAQEKLPNPKIGKNEMEIAILIFEDVTVTYGGQLVYRISAIKKLKVGAGILYGSYPSSNGYGAIFADVLKFLGQRQKWSIGGQIGHGIYDNDYPYVDAGMYYSISSNYRAILSKKLLINTSFLIGYRNFHYSGGPVRSNTAFVGLKAGIVF